LKLMMRNRSTGGQDAGRVRRIMFTVITVGITVGSELLIPPGNFKSIRIEL
jgi:hypothetical protein